MGLGGRGDDAGMEHVRAAERIRRDELQQLIGECTCGACQRQSSRRSGGKRSNRSAGWFVYSFSTPFLREPRPRRRLAFGNRQVPSLEVGDFSSQRATVRQSTFTAETDAL